MARHYIYKTYSVQGRPADINSPGVQADTYIQNIEPTEIGHKGYNTPAGAESFLWLGTDFGAAPDTFSRILLKIRNLVEDSNFKLSDIISMNLSLWGFGDTFKFYQCDLNKDWEELEATWFERISSIAWTEDGAVADTSEPTDSDTCPNAPGPGLVEVVIDLIRWKDKQDINMMLRGVSIGSGTPDFLFNSLENAIAAQKPKLTWIVKVYSPEAFEDQDSMLSVTPYELNPRRPILKWGKIDVDPGFTFFKIYRSTSPFTTPSSATLIATLSDITKTEYVNMGFNAGLDDGVTPPVNGQTYYYMVVVESYDHSGNNGTYSNLVSFKKPGPGSASILPLIGYPGTVATITVTPPTGQIIKEVEVNWRDGITSWYVLDTPTSGVITLTHVYLSHMTITFPKFSLKDVDGFVSEEVQAGTTIQIGNVDSIAKLLVNDNEVIQGDYIVLNGVFSQPKSSTAIIDRYRFKRDASEAYVDNGDNPIKVFSTAGLVVGTYQAVLEIKTDEDPLVTVTATASYKVISSTPIPLVLTRMSRISSINEIFSNVKDIIRPVGSEGVEHEFALGKKAKRIQVQVMTNGNEITEDSNTIKTHYNNNAYISIQTTTLRPGKTVTFAGKIEGDLKIDHSSPRMIKWNFTLRVISESEA